MLNKIKSMILKWLFNNSIQYKNLIDGNLTTKEYINCSYPKALQEDIKALKCEIEALDDSMALAIRMCKLDYEGLQESHNKLGCEVTLLNDDSLTKTDNNNDKLANDIMDEMLYKVAPEHIKSKALSIIKKHINLGN